MKKLFALSGKKLSGKDTVAEHINDTFGGLCLHIGFADPLRKISKFFIETVYGTEITDEHINGSKKEEPLVDSNDKEIFIFDKNAGLVNTYKQASYRDFAQTVGTEYGRMVLNEQIWTETAMRTILANYDLHEHFIISDCRFKSEVEFLKKECPKNNLELVLIRMERDNPNKDTHPSEIDLDDYKFENIIDNNGSLEDLYTQVDKII